MSAMSPIIHACFVMADSLDRVCDEMPEPVCKEQRLVVAGLARAFQLTGEQLKNEETARERKLMEPAHE